MRYHYVGHHISNKYFIHIYHTGQNYPICKFHMEDYIGSKVKVGVLGFFTGTYTICIRLRHRRVRKIRFVKSPYIIKNILDSGYSEYSYDKLIFRKDVTKHGS